MTATVFVIRNQHQQYLDKKQGWQSGKDNGSLYSVAHHDEALNSLLELNAKDIELRGTIVEVDKDEKKRPIVEIDEGALELDRIAAQQAKERLLDPANYQNEEPKTDSQGEML